MTKPASAVSVADGLKESRRGVSIALSRRPIFWLGLYATILSSWGLLFLMHGDEAGALIYPLHGMQHAAVGTDFLRLTAMWFLMCAAMMLPTFIPALQAFDELTECGAVSGASSTALVAGYLVVWSGFSVFGAWTQASLSERSLVAHDGTSLSIGLNAALLFLAGAYQLSPIKNACLARCRYPLAFYLERWKPGLVAAFRMGAELGLYCLGCCWALMALGFVGGTMNLVWMGVATLFMTLEKLPALGRFLTFPSAVACLCAGTLYAFRAINLI